MELILEELLNIPDCPIRFSGDVGVLKNKVTGFSINSRTIKQGEIFIAIKGERFDAHQFIEGILKAKKTSLFIVNEQWFQKLNLENRKGNYFVTQDTLFALQEISHYYRLKFNMPLLALTGSNGKTTTKEMIAAVLSQRYNVLKNKGNLNNHIGLPLTLFDLNNAYDFAITEMGTNSWGEIARLAQIADPTHGLITNIGPAHLEFFKNLKGVFKAKSELWQYLEKKNGIAFVNVDDPFLGKNIPNVRKVITYGFENNADFHGEFLGIDKQGRASFRVDDMAIKLSISGKHNIYNALSAVAIGETFEIERDSIKHALENFEPADKRMEIIHEKEFTIINDSYNSNPESVKKALHTLSLMETKGRRFAVLGDMFELGDAGEREHKNIGKYVASMRNVHFLITHGKLSALTAEEAANRGMQHVHHFVQKNELIDYLKKNVHAGDMILVKGSRGMAMEEVTQALVKS